MTEDVLSYALRYLEKGLSVIPLRYGGKEALIKWSEFQERLPTEEEVKEWFSRGEHNVAIVCGKVSGNLVVLDFDDMEIFNEWYKRIDEEHPDLRDIVLNTWVVETGKGIHIYLRLKDPSLVPRTKPKAGKKPIDIKGEGGYVVAPPSKHPNGKSYTFRTGGINEPITIIEDPRKWKELLRSIGVEEAATPKVVKGEGRFRYLNDNTLLTLKDKLKGVWVEGARQYLALFLSGWFAKARVHPKSCAKLFVLLAEERNDNELESRLSTIYYSYRKYYGDIEELKELDDYIEKLRNDGIISRGVSKGITRDIEENIKGKSGVQEVLEGVVDEGKALDIIRQIEEVLGVASPFMDSVYGLLDYDKQLYAVANLRKLETVRAKRKDDKVVYMERIAVGAPTKVIHYINPLGGITKYEVLWETRIRPRPLRVGPAPIEDIVERLKAEGLVLNHRLVKDILNAIVVEGFVKKGRAEIREEIEAPGFYLVNGKILAVRWKPKEITRKELREALELLNELATVWFKHVEERFATVIKWYTIAPFIYIYKQKNRWVVWPFLYGPPDTGKSTQSKAGASIWGLHLIEKPGSAASTPARLEKILSESTFPIMIKEPGEMLGREDVTEMIKSAVEDVLARGKFVRGTYVETPALAPIVFTSNRYMPREPGLSKRLLLLIYTYGEKIPKEKQKLFKEEVEPRFNKLAALGHWITNKIINNPELLERNWKQLSIKLLEDAYEEAGLDKPEWIELWYENEENVYEDIKEGIRNYLLKRINEEFTRFVGRVIVEKPDSTSYLTKEEIEFEDRVKIVLKNNLLPWAVLRDDMVVFTTGVVDELRHIVGDIGGLKSIAELLGWEYRSKYSYRENGVPRNRSVMLASIRELIEFLKI